MKFEDAIEAVNRALDDSAYKADIWEDVHDDEEN